jgi:hypothetical protein
LSKKLRLFKNKKVIILSVLAIMLIVSFSLVKIRTHHQNDLKEKASLAAAKIVQEADAKKKAEEEAIKKADEEEAKKKAAEEEAKKAAEEAAKKAAEEEAKKKAQEVAAKKASQEEAAKRKALEVAKKTTTNTKTNINTEKKINTPQQKVVPKASKPAKSNVLFYRNDVGFMLIEAGPAPGWNQYSGPSIATADLEISLNDSDNTVINIYCKDQGVISYMKNPCYITVRLQETKEVIYTYTPPKQ